MSWLRSLGLAALLVVAAGTAEAGSPIRIRVHSPYVAGSASLEFSNVAATAHTGDVISDIAGIAAGYTPVLTGSGGGAAILSGSHLFVGASPPPAGSVPLQISEVKTGAPTRVTNLTLTVLPAGTPTLTGGALGTLLDRSTFSAADYDTKFENGLSVYDPVSNKNGTFANYFQYGSPGASSGRTVSSGGVPGGADVSLYVDQYYRGLGLNPYSWKDGIVSIGVFPTPSVDVGNYAANTGLQGFAYYTGMIGTGPLFMMVHGCYEARAVVSSGHGANSGIWGAIWAYHNVNSTGSTELDSLETPGVDGFSTTQATTDWQTAHRANGTSDNSTQLIRGQASGYHTYTLCRSPTDVRWYVDDVLTKISTESDTDLGTDPLYLLITGGPSNSANFPNGGGTWSPTTSPVTDLKTEVQYLRHYPIGQSSKVDFQYTPGSGNYGIAPEPTQANQAGLVAGTDFRNTMYYVPSEFPSTTGAVTDVNIVWRGPAAAATGVWGFNFINFGNYFGDEVGTPIPIKQVSAISTLTCSAAVSLGGTPANYNVIHDLVLSTSAGWNFANIAAEFEVALHLSTAGNAYVTGLTSLASNWADSLGQHWDIYYQASPADIFFVPHGGSDLLNATVDLKGMFNEAVTLGKITSSDYFIGAAVGVENIQGNGAVAIPSYGCTYS